MPAAREWTMLLVSWYLQNATMQHPIAVIIQPTDPSLWQYSRATDIYIERVTIKGALKVYACRMGTSFILLFQVKGPAT